MQNGVTKLPEKKRRVSTDKPFELKLNQGTNLNFESSSSAQVSSTFAPNGLKQDFEETPATHIELVNECLTEMTKVDGLMAHIAKLMYQSVVAKSKEDQMATEAANKLRAIKESYAGEMAALKEANTRALADLQKANEMIKAQNEAIKKCNAELQSAKRSLEQEHKLLVTELQAKHSIIVKMEKMEKDHAQKMVEKEKVNQALVKEKVEMEAKFQRKYSSILDEIKKAWWDSYLSIWFPWVLIWLALLYLELKKNNIFSKPFSSNPK